MDEKIKANVFDGETWKRGLFMLVFAVVYSVAEFVLTALVLFQFGSRLFTGRVNERLLAFGTGLATYLYQILLFMTFRTDDMPYPFNAWPENTPALPIPKPVKKPEVKSGPDEHGETETGV